MSTIIATGVVHETGEIKSMLCHACNSTIPICVLVYNCRHCPVLLVHILLRGALQEKCYNITADTY